jgi:hypothetical protein
MKKDRIVAIGVAFAMAVSTAPAALLAQQSTTLSGTAKDQAKSPYDNYKVQALDVKAGKVDKETKLGAQGDFTLTDLSTKSYLVQLLDKNGKVVCSEGPFDMSQQAIKSNVVIKCGKNPATLALLGAAAAAGVTAGVVAGGGDTPAPAAVGVQAASTASASR